jgi:hypothetical protein
MAGALTAAIAAAFSGGGAPPVVTDDYFEYTTLLLPGNGTNGAQNNTFLDGSTNNFTITRNGNTTQGTFSPFSQTGWGNYFKTGTDAITSASSSGFAFGTGNYTIEAQIYWSGSSSEFQITGSSSNNFNLYVNATTIGFYDGTSGITRTTTISKNTWLYIALVRSGGLLTFYLNGSAVGSTTASSTNYSAFQLIAGRNATSGTSWADGYISNLRVSNVARTISSTPTSAYTQDSNTVFLLGNTNRFLDQGVNGLALTITGTPTVVAFSPFNPTASWSAATYGGSGYFDGSGDYLTGPTNTAFDFSTGTFSVEFWVFPSDLAFRIYLSAPNNGSTQIGYDPGNGPRYLYFYNSSIVFSGQIGTFAANQWNHIVLCRSGTTLSMFCNGTRVYTNASYSSSINFSNPYVGEYHAIGYPTLGYISNVRFVKSSTPYDPTSSAITVPTAPLTAITNTSLLLNFTNAGIYDATSKNDLETVGNAQISTAQSKWGGSSMAFDGTGDYLQAPDTELLEFGSGDFTIETWVRFAALPSSGAFQTLISKFDNSTQKSYSFYVYNNAGTYQLYFTYTTNGSTNVNPVANGITVTTNTWYHYAVCRSGANLRMFIDGTQVGSTYNISTDSIFGGTYPVQVGASTASNVLNGFLQDTRVTKGYARYTANFTAPTAAFPTL